MVYYLKYFSSISDFADFSGHQSVLRGKKGHDPISRL